MKHQVPMEQRLDELDWKPTGEVQTGELPVATHIGYLDLGPVQLKALQLSDGRRVFDLASVAKMMGVTQEELEAQCREMGLDR